MTRMVGVGRLVRDLEDLAGAGSWSWMVGEDRLDWSPELSRIYGLDPSDAPASYEAFIELVHPKDREQTRQVVEEALASARDTEYQHRIVRGDGAVRMLWSLVRIQTDEHGAITGLRGACQDITEKLDLQERLSRAQALATAGYVATGLSHDLNNLLSVMVVLAQAVSDPSTPDKRAELLDQLQQVVLRAAGMTSRIQQLATRGTLAPTPTANPKTVIGGLATVLSSVLPRGIDRVIDVREAPDAIGLDRFSLERVLWNLIINAVHALPNGGEIRISADTATVDGCQYGCVVVTDNGVGMSEEARARVLEPFFTTKGEDGTGVGMSIVADIVAEARGLMTVESAQGRGTSFKIYIPLA